MTASIPKKAAVSCRLEISDNGELSQCEGAISQGRHFSYAIPYISGQTIRKGLCLLNSFGPSVDWRDRDDYYYACLANTGGKITSAQRYLKLSDFVLIDDASFQKVIEHTPKKFHHLIRDGAGTGFRMFGDKTGQHLWDAIKATSSKTDELEALERLSRRQIIPFGTERGETVAAEKDATGLCLEIAGFDRKNILLNWDPTADAVGRSFLRGLPQHRAYEDDLIAHDLSVLPGWDRIENDITGVADFEDGAGKTLTIINANRKPLEKALGVDLIYFHRHFEAFTFVQYKMMDDETANGDIYYNPRKTQDYSELQRMRRLWRGLKKTNRSDALLRYRFGLCPIFFKLCKRLVLKGESGGIAAGAYIPLDHWQKLLISPITKGPRGGRQIGYFNLGKRYVKTTTFVEFVQTGLIGTKNPDTAFVADIVEQLVGGGHSVLYAIEQRLKGRSTK